MWNIRGRTGGQASPLPRTLLRDRRIEVLERLDVTSAFRMARLRICPMPFGWSGFSKTSLRRSTMRSLNFESPQERLPGDYAGRREDAASTDCKRRRTEAGSFRLSARPPFLPPYRITARSVRIYLPLVTVIPVASVTFAPPCTDSSGFPGSVW